MTGSLQVKNGVYYAVLNFKDKSGKRKQKWISTELTEKGNKRKAEQVLNDLKAQYDESDYIEPSKVLFCDYLTEWIELNKNSLQVTTYDNYKHMLNKHIYPYFKEKGIVLSKLKPIDIQRYYSEKLKDLSPNTVIKHHGIIRSSIAYAVKTNLIRTNVADLVDKPKRERYEGSAYTIDELNKLFVAAKGSSIETPILIAAFYGLRRSEVLGLTWDAIDFDNKIISIRRKVVRGYNEDGKLVTMPQNKLKSETSYRSLPLCGIIHDYLKQIKEEQEHNKQIMGNEYNHEFDDYICVNPMGALLNPDYISDVFSKLLAKNGLRHIRYHDLRHSCATLLVHLGFNLKDVQEWLGHSDFLITANTYTHVDMTEKVKMMDSVADSFELTKALYIHVQPECVRNEC